MFDKDTEILLLEIQLLLLASYRGHQRTMNRIAWSACDRAESLGRHDISEAIVDVFRRRRSSARRNVRGER